MKAYTVYLDNNLNMALAWLLIDMGNIYFYAEQYEEAKIYYDKSFEKFNEKGFHLGLSVLYLNYGLIKEQQNDIDSALYYFNKSLEERTYTYDPYLIAHIYHYIARVQIKDGNFNRALTIINKSNSILLNHPKIIDLHLQLIYSNYTLLAQSYEKQKNLNTAVLYVDSALYYAYMNTDTLKIFDGQNYIGDLYVALNKPMEAIHHFEKALEVATNEETLENKPDILLRISDQYLKLKNYRSIAIYLEQHEIAHKSIFTFNEKRKYESLVLALESQLKEIEFDKITKKEKINKQIIIILLVCIILAIIISTIFYYFKTRLWKSNKELINTAFDGIVIHRQGVIYDVNESFMKFSGYNFKELKNHVIFDFLEPEIHKKAEENINKNLNSNLTFKIKHKDGTLIDVEAESRPMTYYGKKMRLVTIRDISEQIKANTQIQLFKTIIEQNYSSIVITDTKGNIEYVNPSFTQMTGYTFDEAHGRNPKILKSDLHDDIFYKNLWDNLNAGKPWNGIFKNIDKYGKYFWEEATITPIKDHEDHIINFVAIKQDITLRKELEDKIKQFNAQFRKIFESIDSFVFVIDFETEKIISANLKTKLSFGDVEEKNFNDVIFNGEKKSAVYIHKDILLKEEQAPLNEKEIIKEEIFIKSKNSWYDFNMLIIPWVDDIKAILIVANDITERKNTILRLNELNATKDKFFSIISHDLKNPFHTLIGFSEILLDDFDYKDTKNTKMILSHIHSVSKTSFRLLENLLEWANLQKGLIQIEKKNFNLLDTTLQTIELKQPFYSQKNIKIKTQIPKTLEVFSDMHVLTTVLRNLLSNAIKFTSQNGKILIMAEENNDEVIIAVKDNGVGIPKEMLPKLFRIETKYSVVGTEGELGNGLGLILCKELIDKIGGRIYAESKVDDGTTFYFTVNKSRTTNI